jgi:hypothetical protein
MRMPLAILLLAAALATGCGAEVAGTAATAAKLQATQAEQAAAQQDQFRKKLDGALQAGAAAASAAAGR